jgi:DNA-binding CsgD family transcriptional regulator
MNTQILISLLKNEMNELLSNYYCPVTPEMNQLKVNLLNSFPVLAPLEKKSYHTFDLNEGFFSSTNSIYEKNLLKPVIYANQQPNSTELIELTHPDDIIFSLKLEIAAIQFLQLLPATRAKEFSMSYPRRLMNKKGEFDCYIISYKVVVSSEEGKPWLLLMHSVLCPLIPSKDDSRYRIISIEPYDLFKKSKIFDKNEFIVLTNREKEVVGEVNKGFTKDKIAESLHISPKTIKTHFKNIAKKAGLSYIHQACLHIIRMGIIPIWMLFSFFCTDDYFFMVCNLELF